MIESDYIPKTYYHNFYGEFNISMLENFTNLLNHTSEEDNIEITLESNGGEAMILYAILRIINREAERFTLIVGGLTSSCGLNLLLMSDCKKEFLISYTGGLMHNSYMEIDTNQLSDRSDEQIMEKIKNLKSFNNKVNKFFEAIGIPESKLSRVAKNQDVFITRGEIINACKIKERENIKFKI